MTPPGRLPHYVPMLATRWPSPFSDEDWAFEVKWDGIRALLYFDGLRAHVHSRTGRNVTASYPELAGLSFDGIGIFDGEIVAFDGDGHPSFGALQRRMNLRGAADVARAAIDNPVGFVVFDLLHAEGPLINDTWDDRMAALAEFDLPPPCTRSQPTLGDGEALWEAVEHQGLEGIVAKRRDSPYRPGVRSPDWRKVARVQHVRAVVGGFTSGHGSREATFGGLLLGLVDGESLRYIGSVGTGFDAPILRLIREALDEMTTAESPFHDDDLPRDVTWIHPRLVAVVRFKEWTAAGRLRAPVFHGFVDHDWETVTLAEEGPA